MFKSLLGLVLIISASAAQANALDCTPSVRAQNTLLMCATKTKHYAITIETIMSPSECYSQGKYQEINKAIIEVSKIGGDGSVLGKFVIPNGKFSYDLSYDRSSFSSPDLGIKFNNCITPMHGGFSVGN